MDNGLIIMLAHPAPTGLSQHQTAAREGIIAAMLVSRSTSFPRWYVNPATGEPIERNFGEVVALMHSEVSEGYAHYAARRNDDHLPHRLGIEVEIADLLHRIFDTSVHLGMDIAGPCAIWMRSAPSVAAAHPIERKAPEDMTPAEQAAYDGLRAAQALTEATEASPFLDMLNIHCRLSDALEHYRKDRRDKIATAFAAAVRQALAVSRWMNLDVPGAFIEKDRYNRTRADHQDAARRLVGGKRF